VIEDEPAAKPEQSNPPAATAAPAARPPAARPPARERWSRSWSRRAWLLWTASLLVFVAALAVTGLAAGYRYAETVIQPTRRHVAGLDAVAPGAPVNLLIVGSDSRQGLTDEELAQARTERDGGAELADTIILVHVSPARRKVVMVSLPRDLRVSVDGRSAKINSVFDGRPERLVRVVQRTTGLKVHHFVEVNFAGFLKLVDVLGGVRLCNHTGQRLQDKDAGLNMAPGCHVMNGPDALAFVRARKIDSDFGRMERQQQFARAVMDRLADHGNLVNLPKLNRIARELSRNVRTDDALASREALSLARRVGSLGDEDVDMRIYPSVPVAPACGGCPAYVEPLPEARLLMRAIAADAAELPPVGRTGVRNVTLRGVPVLVRNASGVRGRASAVARVLRDDFDLDASAGGGTARPIGSAAQVTYPRRLAAQARLLAALVGGQVRLTPAGGDGPRRSLVLTVGPGFARLR
jgi:LCP family protein required for cell wall assembly